VAILKDLCAVDYAIESINSLPVVIIIDAIKAERIIDASRRRVA